MNGFLSYWAFFFMFTLVQHVLKMSKVLLHRVGTVDRALNAKLGHFFENYLHLWSVYEYKRASQYVDFHKGQVFLWKDLLPPQMCSVMM